MVYEGGHAFMTPLKTVLAATLMTTSMNVLIAATIIVDPGCPISGTGKSEICSAASPSDNPVRTIQDAVSIASGGDCEYQHVLTDHPCSRFS
jgi:hypothetical protein